MFKRKVIRAVVSFLDGWNKVLHETIEERVFAEHHRLFPDSKEEDDFDQMNETIVKMREFYYQRMMNTGALMVGFLSLIVAFIALIVSMIAIFT